MKSRYLKTVLLIIGSILIVSGITAMAIGWPVIGTISGKEYFESDQAFRIIHEKNRDPSIEKGERFEDYDPGDTIIIIDKIDKIVYNKTVIMNDTIESTLIYLNSNPKLYFRIEGDITGEFKKGDSIIIKLYIVENPNYNPQVGYGGNDPFHFKEKLEYKEFIYNTTYYGMIPKDQISKPPETLFYLGIGVLIFGIIIITVYIIHRKGGSSSSSKSPKKAAENL